MNNSNPNTATVSARKPRISIAWLIPVIVVLVGCWLVYQTFLSSGPKITVRLDNAEGIEANKTAVKVRDVEVGKVVSVELTEDYDGALAIIQMNPDTRELLAKDSQFWVVKPRIGRHGISGLGTLMSGAYIQMRPGKNKDKRATGFNALNHPPVTSGSTPGIIITLTSKTGQAVNVGDPVVYQGQSAGTIETAEFSAQDNTMRYRVFIKQPFSRLVSKTTQFWLNSGIDFHLGAGGIDVQAGSLQSILAGGITFEQPDDVDPAGQVDSGAEFELYASKKSAQEDRFDRRIPYMVLIDESVRGLKEGAPVLFRGVRIGTVRKVPFFTPEYDSSQYNHRIPILITIEPQRVTDWMDWPDDKWHEQLEKFFDHGLRARLANANLLTGALLVELNFTGQGRSKQPESFGDYAVFPSESGSFTDIQKQFSELLNKLNQIDFKALDTELVQTLHGLNTLINQEDTQNIGQHLAESLDALQQTLNAYQPGQPAYDELEQALNQLDRLLQNLTPLSQTLKEQPNALIFGPKNRRDPQPQSAPAGH